MEPMKVTDLVQLVANLRAQHEEMQSSANMSGSLDSSDFSA